MEEKPCKFCKNLFPFHCAVCIHCGEPALHANVERAELPQEQAALQSRYEAAYDEARSQGREAALHYFEQEMCQTVAVIARSRVDLERLAYADEEIYANFYVATRSGIRAPKDDDWTARRIAAESKLFLNYEHEIRFACLSLDGNGLPHYGDCFLILNDSYIAARASAFEENCIIFMDKRDINPTKENVKLPLGFRATWPERQKLCVAKLGKHVYSGISRQECQDLLMHPGARGDEDRFVEVHVHGPLTRRSLAAVRIRGKRRGIIGRKDVILCGIEEVLTDIGVLVEFYS